MRRLGQAIRIEGLGGGPVLPRSYESQREAAAHWARRTWELFCVITTAGTNAWSDAEHDCPGTHCDAEPGAWQGSVLADSKCGAPVPSAGACIGQTG